MQAVLARSRWFFSGLAMFSMFFGAGNIIFPLIVGQTVQGGVFPALVGLILTAVVVPFSGLIAITLFEGDYERFFYRLGKIPGTFLITVMLLLLGPFGALPRCIVLTHSTLSVYIKWLPLPLFTTLFAILVYLCTIKRRRILSLLGYVLTPLLLIFLFTIVIKGMFLGGAIEVNRHTLSSVDALAYGLKEGYNTMDLLAAFFFAAVVYRQFKAESQGDKRVLVASLLKSSIVGASILAIVYSGFAITAAMFSKELAAVHPDRLLGVIGCLVLGKEAGIVVSMIVFLSCLTTAIALATISSDYFSRKMPGRFSSYRGALALILITSCLVSLLEFSGIVKIVAPILELCYPSLIALSFFNIFHALFGINHLKLPFYLILVLTIIKSLSSQ